MIIADWPELFVGDNKITGRSLSERKIVLSVMYMNARPYIEAEEVTTETDEEGRFNLVVNIKPTQMDDTSHIVLHCTLKIKDTQIAVVTQLNYPQKVS